MHVSPPRKTERGDMNRRKPTSALQVRGFLFPPAGQARQTGHATRLRRYDLLANAMDASRDTPTSRKRKRRRGIDSHPLPAQLLLDGQLEVDEGLLSEDLFDEVASSRGQGVLKLRFWSISAS